MTWETLLVGAAKLGLNLWQVVVGAAGALIALTLFEFPEAVKNSRLKRLTIVFAGGCFGGFGTDPALGWLNLTPGAGGITGLVLGLFGISLAMKIFEAIQQINLLEMIKARFGRP